MNKFLISLFIIFIYEKSHATNLKELESLDPFYQRNIRKKLPDYYKGNFTTEEFYLKKGTTILVGQTTKILATNKKVRALYSPSSLITPIINKSGKIIFTVRSRDLISSKEAEKIPRGTLFSPESKQYTKHLSQDSPKLLFRIGYGGSLFRDTFISQFLSPGKQELYAGCLELQTEAFLTSFDKLLIGGGLYLTTGQYFTLDDGPVFQNLSIGPSVKYPLTNNIFIYIRTI